jgi:hypothetical protein
MFFLKCPINVRSVRYVSAVRFGAGSVYELVV